MNKQLDGLTPGEAAGLIVLGVVAAVLFTIFMAIAFAVTR